MLSGPGIGRVGRPALAGRLAQALDAAALLLVAPAGSGKTMALEEALELRGGAVAWVRCSESDRDAGRLLAHVVEALRAAAPGVADALGERLGAGMEPVDVLAATHALIGELDRLLVDPLTIAFDDAEHLDGAQAATGVLAALLAADVPRLRLAIASRRALALGAARLAAGGRLVAPDAGELAFSVDECARLLLDRRPGEAREEDAEELWAATEGWPLGVALAARAERPPALLGRGASALARYLEEELMASLDSVLLDALVDASVVRELDPAMVDALGLPEDFVADAQRAGVPMRVAGGTAAYHPLVREVLSERFRRDRPEARRREVHARAAEALSAAGRGPDAIEHWLAAHAFERAAADIAFHGQELANTAPATVGEWLGRLPGELAAAPELRLLAGRLAAGAGRLDEAIPPLAEALAGFQRRGDSEASWMARVALADAHAIQETFEAVIPLADGFDRSPSPAAPLVAMSAGAALAGLARYAEAEDMLERVVAHPAGAPLAPIAAGFRGFWVDLPCGRLDAALSGTREAVALLERADPVNRLPFVAGFVAVVHEERGEDLATLGTLAYAERVAAERGIGGYLTEVARRFRASVHARAGRLEAAERELAGLGHLPRGWFAGDAEITRAMVAAARGDQSAAVDAAGRAVDAGALVIWRSRSRAVGLLVPVLVAAGRPQWARDLVEDALAARPPLAACPRLLALRGWLRNLEGDDAGALDDTVAAWREAGDGAEHLIRRERARIEPLLWRALEAGLLDPEEVMRAIEAGAPGGSAVLPFTEHPLAPVRRATVLGVAASGHPDAPERLAVLEADRDAGVAAAARAARERLVLEPPPLAFKLLGEFSLRRGAFLVSDEAWGRRRRAAQRLVRFLLVQHGAVSEDDLFEAFWPGAEPESARRSLQVTVSSARAVLDAPGARTSRLATTDRSYRLALARRDVVDAHAFEHAAAAALSASGRDRRALLEAVAAGWAGEPLPEDRYEAWAATPRARLMDLYGRVLAALSEACAEAGDSFGAIDAGRRHVELDPLDEGAHRRLMAAYARVGRRGEALRQYLACRRALVDELGVEPAEETTALQRRILAGEQV